MQPKIGDIVFASTPSLEHREAKYAVCVHADDLLFFFINSENRAIYDCIPILKKDTRPFPKRDSYIACNAAYVLHKTQISYVAKADATELAALLEKVKSSRTLPKQQKDRISSAIENFRK